MTPSDLFLSPDLSEADARKYLGSLGFRDADATDRHLQEMASDVAVREAMGRIAAALLPALLESPDPDSAVVGLSHYLAARTGRAMFLDYLAEDPRALHVLSCVFGSSPLLSEILIHNPEDFHWLVAQIERSAPDRQDLEDDLDTMMPASGDRGELLQAMNRWKSREILRVGTCDLLRRETVPSIARQLSDLADVIVNRVVALAAPATPRGDVQGRFAVIALGQLGGREMSYASHLELMYVFDTPADDDGQAREYFQKQGANLTTMLSGDGEDPLYRTTDVLFHSLSGSQEYYASRQNTADRLALVKARAVAGDAELGRRFLEHVRAFVFRGAAQEDIEVPPLDGTTDGTPEAADLVRRLEACVQLLQLRHAGRARALEQTGTLDVLNSLATEGVITGSDRRELVHAYEFLRGAVHARQLMPDDASAASANLEQQVRAHAARVDAICRRLSGSPGSNQGKD